MKFDFHIVLFFIFFKESLQVPADIICLNTRRLIVDMLPGSVCAFVGAFYIGQCPAIIIFTNPSARAEYDTRSIFKRSLTGLNSEFSFS